MNRRRNETRLLDLNRTLQSRNTELEKRVESLRRDFATDCVSADVIGRLTRMFTMLLMDRCTSARAS